MTVMAREPGVRSFLSGRLCMCTLLWGRGREGRPDIEGDIPGGTWLARAGCGRGASLFSACFCFLSATGLKAESPSWLEGEFLRPRCYRVTCLTEGGN